MALLDRRDEHPAHADSPTGHATARPRPAGIITDEPSEWSAAEPRCQIQADLVIISRVSPECRK